MIIEKNVIRRSLTCPMCLKEVELGQAHTNLVGEKYHDSTCTCGMEYRIYREGSGYDFWYDKKVGK